MFYSHLFKIYPDEYIFVDNNKPNYNIKDLINEFFFYKNKHIKHIETRYINTILSFIQFRNIIS